MASVNVNFHSAAIICFLRGFLNKSLFTWYETEINTITSMNELGLSHQYLIDAVFRTNIKMIPALVFWCLLLTQYKCLISNHAGGEEQAGLDYSEINYIGEVQPGKCLQPRPPRALP